VNKAQFKALIKSIPAGVHGILTATLDPPPAGPLPDPPEPERVPLILDRFVADEPKKWANLLRSPRHKVDDEDIVHCFMTYISGIFPYEEPTLNSMSLKVRVNVDSYIQLYSDVGDLSPSAILDDEIAGVIFDLKHSDYLNVPGVPLASGGTKQYVSEFTELSENRRPARLGEVPVLQSIGQMIVTLQPIMLPNLPD
jgi:hypothetical protein